MNRCLPIICGSVTVLSCFEGQAAAQSLQVRQTGTQVSAPRDPDLIPGGGGLQPGKIGSTVQHFHLNLLLDSGTSGPGSDAGFGDASDVASSIPPCPADLDHDRSVTISDLITFLDLFDASSPRADISRDSAVDLADLFLFLEAFDRGC